MTANKLKFIFKSIQKKYFNQVNATVVPCVVHQKSNLINLGCGSTYSSAWDNFDLIPADPAVTRLDLLKPFPFQNSSYQYCYSSHVLEHMPRSYAPQFLKEMFRILEPAGIIRVVVPDLEEITRRYLAELDAASLGDEAAIARHQWMSIELLDQMTRSFSGGFMGRLWYSRPLYARELIEQRLGGEASKWLKKFDEDFAKGEQPLNLQDIYSVLESSMEKEVEFRKRGEIHRWMYDRVSLGALLKEAGFHNIKVCKANESAIPDFVRYNLDTDELEKVRKPDSLFMEAVR